MSRTPSPGVTSAQCRVGQRQFAVQSTPVLDQSSNGGFRVVVVEGKFGFDSPGKITKLRWDGGLLLRHGGYP
jgi:hypothetical protein